MQAIRFLIFPLAMALLPFSAMAQSHPMPRRANIILIVADGLGYRDLSCYGQTMFQTPGLDRLAIGGMRFTNYFAGDALSSAARADLLLGKHVGHAPRANVNLGPSDQTIAAMLRNSGYHTGLIGEWNLGDENSAGAPWLQGFDDFAGYMNSADAANPFADYVWRYDRRVDRQGHQTHLFNGRENVYANTGGKEGEYLPDAFLFWISNFNKINQPDMFNDYRPFFLVLDETIPGSGPRPVPSDAPFSEEPWPQAEKNRAAAIIHLDDDIGRLLENLDNIGQASNTVIFLTSDTIPQKAGGVEPKFFNENFSTNDLRVPMIVYWPGRIAPGQVSGLKCSAQDVLPTIADIALLERPKNIDGVSFSPTLFGQ